MVPPILARRRGRTVCGEFNVFPRAEIVGFVLRDPNEYITSTQVLKGKTLPKRKR